MKYTLPSIQKFLGAIDYKVG